MSGGPVPGTTPASSGTVGNAVTEVLEIAISIWIGINALFVFLLVAASWIKPKPQHSEETVMIDVTRLLRGSARIQRLRRRALHRGRVS